jgi:hypothetical protein
MRPVTGIQDRTLLLTAVAIVLGIMGMHSLSPDGTGMTNNTPITDTAVTDAAVTDRAVTGEAAMHAAHGSHAA